MNPHPKGGGFVFIYMKPFEKFLNDTLATKELLEIYLELRQEFQELGFSESDLSNPPTYTLKMMNLFHKFGDTQKALLKQVNDYGFDITFDELVEYMKPLMEKINELTPLKENGNNKRRNNRDEN
jgi:vacuolar-type H+-ATPase catalytic subunit A/Vma1